MMKNIKNEKLLEAMISLIKGKYYFYGEFLLYLDFFESNSIETLGVTIDKKTKRFKLIYNPDFLNLMNDNQSRGILIHEVFHLISSHLQRVEISDLDPMLSNIAQDMIINSFIEKEADSTISLPDGALYVPSLYNEELIFETLYTWLLKEQESLEKDSKENGTSTIKKKKSKSKSSSSMQNGQNNSEEEPIEQEPFYHSKINTELSKPRLKNKEKQKLEDLKKVLQSQSYQMDEHLTIDNEISQMDRDRLVDEIMNELKAKGHVTDNLQKIINKFDIRKSKENIFLKIKRAISKSARGSIRNPTFKRLNRRFPGIVKGYEKLSNNFNVILDTSGSMEREFEKVLSYLLHSANEFNLIQIDTEIKDIIKIKNKNQLKNLTINGLGGTELQPAIEKLKEIKQNNIPLIILTDGYTDMLNLTDFVEVIGITTEKELPIKYKPRRYLEFKVEAGRKK